VPNDDDDDEDDDFEFALLGYMTSYLDLKETAVIYLGYHSWG
jgi:hypothetical protein